MAGRRLRGTGSVFRRRTPAGVRWVAQVSILGPDGKRTYVTRWRRTPDEAKRALEAMLARRDVGGDIADDRLVLGVYLERWLEDVAPTVRTSTLVSYTGHVRLHIDPVLGGIPVGEVRKQDVNRLIRDRLAAGLAPATVQRIRTTLGMALGAALGARNPVRETRQPRVERPPVEPMTRASADAVLAAVAGSWVELPVRVWLGSGLRRGEVLGLDQRDLHLDAGYVVVRVSKTRVRAVPISDDATDALRAALSAAPRRGPAEPVFFGRRTGDRLRGDSVTAALKRLAGLSPHALRHGAATLMLADGHGLAVIGEQLGHRSPRTTAIYAHVVPEAQRAAVRSLERADRTS